MRFRCLTPSLQVLYPSGTGDGGNDDSIVLYGEFFQTKFLFTGDLERQGEIEQLQRFPQLKADVLKAGHHGSKGSFQSRVFRANSARKLALIVDGQNNRYRHPYQETLCKDLRSLIQPSIGLTSRGPFVWLVGIPGGLKRFVDSCKLKCQLDTL